MEEALEQIKIAQFLLDDFKTSDKDALAAVVALKITVAKARHALQQAMAVPSCSAGLPTEALECPKHPGKYGDH